MASALWATSIRPDTSDIAVASLPPAPYREEQHFQFACLPLRPVGLQCRHGEGLECRVVEVVIPPWSDPRQQSSPSRSRDMSARMSPATPANHNAGARNISYASSNAIRTARHRDERVTTQRNARAQRNTVATASSICAQ